MEKSNSRRKQIASTVAVERASRTLPWFRVVFGVIGTLSPGLLGRWYGLTEGDASSQSVALRYACIRALGLGIGQLTASSERRREWDRVALLVDVLDTAMVCNAGIRGRISTRSMLVMMSGTATGVVVGFLTRQSETRER
ncbi:uncharacterized protein Nmag_4168 (plasmid) [Natrialba magadii ATCC 43099]|uniref:Uncharacterized protein n=1 Tax=Natrialba magadii (strain ATCC 43099 / DSM 3394 / CCM 3739 / CIP 104546 / IAM 13178 / JCM 8861 / NBRC 102185 / NCIMB 2190 / MS3) TaxID=547559 RepID=D3T272_NATMM|nr:uncharacterized protein Nmag_4168 [Natrialba magadii ATCC 43099]